MSLDKLYADKPTRSRVADYIERAIDESKKEGGEESSSGSKADQLQVSICRENIMY